MFIWDLGSGIRDPGSGIRDRDPGWDPGSGIRDLGSGIWDPATRHQAGKAFCFPNISLKMHHAVCFT